MDKRISILSNMLYSSNVKISVDNNNRIIIDGDIIMFDDLFDSFPVKIHKVNGNIEWHGNINKFDNGSLTTLKNFPDIVTGNVYIYKNPKLTSLNGCPKEIGGSLVCDHCNISDISGIGTNIGKYFIASSNPISDISVLNNIKIGTSIELVNVRCVNENISNINGIPVVTSLNTNSTIFNE